MSIVLTPPFLIPDYWLICPTCVYLVTLLICSLYNLLVFAVLCQFTIYVIVECSPALPLSSWKMSNFFQLYSQDINWCTGVVWITCVLLWCFYQLFGLSFWRHPFTAEHPLLSKWCKRYISPNLFWWRNKFIYILDGLCIRKYCTFWCIRLS